MLVLCIRTDKPESELYVYRDKSKIAIFKWQAHRKLADTLHQNIENILNETNNNLPEIDGIIIYQGPGSFTGLRIGFSVANALGYSLDIPVVVGDGENWVVDNLDFKTTDFNPVQPMYGSEPHITTPKK